MLKRTVTQNSVTVLVKCTLKYVVIPFFSQLNSQILFEMRPSMFSAQFIAPLPSPPHQVTPIHAHVRIVVLLVTNPLGVVHNIYRLK